MDQASDLAAPGRAPRSGRLTYRLLTSRCGELPSTFPSPSLGEGGLAQALGYRLGLAGHEVAVAVEGHRRGGVAEHPLQNEDVGAGSNGQSRTGVAQVVDPQRRHAGDLGRWS